MAPALRFVFGIKAEVNQRIVALAGFHHNVAPAPAVAARWTSTRHELLAPEGNAAIAAIARLHSDFCFVDEHRQTQIQRARNSSTGTLMLCWTRVAVVPKTRSASSL